MDEATNTPQFMTLTNEEVTEIVTRYKRSKRKYLPHYNVPNNVVDQLDAYMELRVAPSSFLQAVFANNLFASINAADVENRSNLADIVTFITHVIPSIARDITKWTELVIQTDTQTDGQSGTGDAGSGS